MTRILYLDWNSFAGEYMKYAFVNAGVEVVLFPFDFNNVNNRKDTRMDATLTESIVRALMSGSFDALFSFNYFPVAAIACKACRVRYISWVYDSPYIQLYSQTIHFETNDIHLFDKAEVIRLQNMGIKTVSYLPLAASPIFLKNVIATASKDCVKRYTSDISFVGAMYTEPRQQLFERLHGILDSDMEYLENLIERQKDLYGENIIEKALTPDLIERMNEVCPVYLHGDGFETKEWVYTNYYLYRHVTALERTEIMNLLSEKNYDLHIYTHPQQVVEAKDGIEKQPHLTDKALPKICGKVDYYKEAPVVFANSKINLNITLRSIQSGIPLRAFEIMGSGGFLLTNYQEDFLEFFEPDKDFVYYEDYEDMLGKIDYYLEHDNERERIAASGRKKVHMIHSYDKRVTQLI